MTAVSVRDARTLIDIAGDLEYDSRRSAFASEGLFALCELLEADWLTYCECTAAHCTVMAEVGTRPFGGNTEALETIFCAYLHEFPLHRAGSREGVFLIGDVASDRAWRRTTLYNEWCRAAHVEPQATIVLTPTGSPVSRRLMIDIADDAPRSFGERERTLLELIRPALLRPIARAEATRQRHRALGLTPRELEVLDLVRDGLTNGEIAARLFVSPATVRSHLENAFAKLGAHTRTEAVARLEEIS